MTPAFDTTDADGETEADVEVERVDEATEIGAELPDPEINDELYLLAVTISISDPLDKLSAVVSAEGGKTYTGGSVVEVSMPREAVVTDRPS